MPRNRPNAGVSVCVLDRPSGGVPLPATAASAGAHYPQGLVSTLYRLNDRIPVDFDLVGHGNERQAALTHLDHAAEGDIIVYDRGYFSFAMALAHQARGLNFVFRIARHTSPALDAFIASPDTDRNVTFEASRDAPARRGRTCRLRLVQYTAADTAYCLATSLLDRHRYPVHTLSDLDHGRRSQLPMATTTAKEQVAQASRRLTAAPARKTQASKKTPEAQGLAYPNAEHRHPNAIGWRSGIRWCLHA